MVLYLIPTTLGETDLDRILPAYNNEIVNRLDFFIVEDVRTARRFLKKINPATDIDSKTFYVLNQHTRPEEIAGFLKPLSEGREVGVISEAGCPAIADPGADVVAIAQEKGFKVVPLVGPSSILLALMASGFNGQSFAFNGYLPVQPADRTKAIKRLENRAHNEKQSQIFIETPYRNDSLMEDLIACCKETTRICIAADLTLPQQYICTRTVAGWRNSPITIGKRPCVFVLLA